MGKLSSHFNPCLNTCLEASWCTVVPQQAALAASACSLQGTAVGPVLVTHGPAVPGVKQQLCFLWGKGSALLERMADPAFPTAQTRCLWYCVSARWAQPQVPTSLSPHTATPSMTTGQRATPQLPPSREQGIRDREWICFCTKNHHCEWVAWNYYLGTSPCCAIQTQKYLCCTGKAAVPFMQNNGKGKAVFCLPACTFQNGQNAKNNVKKISNKAAYVYPLWDSLLSY